MGLKRGFALLALGVTLVAPATANASMQLVSVSDPTPAKTFLSLDGYNTGSEQDVISVSQSGSDIVITDQAGISTFPANCQRLAPTGVACPFAAFDEMSLHTGPGNDQFVSTLAGPNLTLKQIFGPTVAVYLNAVLGPGTDRFNGGAATEAVHGGPGGDVVIGGDGNDFLAGSGGNDRVFGGVGTDFLAGDAGRDHLTAGPGLPDFVDGGKGGDACFAHEGRDRFRRCEKVGVR